MPLVVRGRAWVLGDHVSTDHIISGKYKYEKMGRLEEMKKYVFAELIPGFYERVRPGDVIVAGRGFGYGSSREHAARLLRMLGVGAVVAKSFHRIFYRNAVNNGLPPVIAERIPDVTVQGDVIEIWLDEGVVVNVSRGVSERFRPFPRFLLRVIEEGGLIDYYRRHGRPPWRV